jgi:hypothetical protein
MNAVATRHQWHGLDVAALLPWLAIATLWMVVTDYARVQHDALLYSFQSVARLRPELYSGDLFLRYGSQDTFTAFSSLYSWLVGNLGVEAAAAWTTFVAMLALLFASWLLARRLATPAPALMGLGFLVALPTGYGAYGIFHVIEPFVSPRMPAEALAIGALLAVLAKRRLLAAALLAASACMHPLMAAPVMLIAVSLALPVPYRRRLAALCVLGVLLLAAVGRLSILDPLRVDAAWRDYFDNFAAYLFTANWRSPDWIGLCPPLLTLWLASGTLPSAPARQLCTAAALVGLLGLALVLVGADWAGIALVVQGQGYRWMWPATLLAPLVLPAIGLQLWRLGTNGHAAALALAATWFSLRESFAPVVFITTAVIGVIALRDLLAPASRRWILIGAALMLLITAASSLSDRVLVAQSPFQETRELAAVPYLRYLFSGGLVPVTLLLGVFALAARPARHGIQAVVALGLLVAAVPLVPVSVASWSKREYPSDVYAKFSTWRALIPAGSEVVWIDRPDAAWLLLERPSYFSVQQSMSGVFARSAVPEIMSRETRLVPFMLADGLRGELAFAGERRIAGRIAASTLDQVCEAIDARFVVARGAFKETPLALAPPDVPANYRTMKLYQCDSHST